MKDAYYFPHDYNARNDEKILKLWQSKGAAGYGIYWAIVEMVYEAGGVMRLDCDCIAFALHTQCDEVKSVLHDFGLFEIDGTQFTSKRVQESLETRNIKSVNARKSAYKRWNKYESNANAMPTQCEGNAIKERKGKERKRKESIILTDMSLLWNKVCINLPSVKEISKNRKKKEILRLSERNLEEWEKVFIKLNSSEFCKGNNNTGWRATYDWIISNTDNSIKVLEGKYNGQAGSDKLPAKNKAEILMEQNIQAGKDFIKQMKNESEGLF